MTCPHCIDTVMNVEFLDDETKVYHAHQCRVRNECPVCHLRVYSVMREAGKHE